MNLNSDPSSRLSSDTAIISMPALSPTMNAGKIVTWHVKEGDAVKPGMALFDVETDKATVTADATDPGFIARILVQAGADVVKVGDVVALQVDEKGEEPVMPQIAKPGL